jgi:hypothetical protein
MEESKAAKPSMSSQQNYEEPRKVPGRREILPEETIGEMERRYSTEEGVVKESDTCTTRVAFRRGVLEVSDAREFRAGLWCGQAALFGGGFPPTEAYLFDMVCEGMQDILLSESWLVGFFLGMGDALLGGRQGPPNLRQIPHVRLLESPQEAETTVKEEQQA